VIKGKSGRSVWVASRGAEGPEDGGGHPWAGQRQQSSQQLLHTLAKATEGLAKKLGKAGEKLIQVWDLNDLKDGTMEMKEHVLDAQASGREEGGVGEEGSAGRGGGVGEEGSAETCGSSDAMYNRALEIAQRLSGVVQRDGGEGGCDTSTSPISPILRNESSPVSSTGKEDLDEGGMMGLGWEGVSVDQDCNKPMEPSASDNRNEVSASDSKSAWGHENVAVSQPKALMM